VPGSRTVQRTVLYLGEINDQQQGSWRKTLDVFDEDQQDYRTMSLFPDDRKVPADALDSVQVKLSGLELRRPRTFGNCWLGCELWHQLGLDEFWQQRLPEAREALSWGCFQGVSESRRRCPIPSDLKISTTEPRRSIPFVIPNPLQLQAAPSDHQTRSTSAGYHPVGEHLKESLERGGIHLRSHGH
jgi:hypothetical protein